MTTSVTSTISSPGIGSGLDVNSIVSGLISAERSPTDKRLTNATNQDNAQISALGQLKSALSNLQTVVGGLGPTGALGKNTATSGDSTVFGASVTGGVAAGSYNVEVVSLATASKIASGSYASAGAEVGTGAVTVSMGSSSFTVNLSSGADKLSDLVSAINGASNNPGVSASLVSDTGGVHLVLQSQLTGADNAVTLTSAATGSGNSFISTSVLQTPSSAHIRVDGYDYTSDSNTVTGAIGGVSINLLKAVPGTTNTLTVGANTQAAANVVQSFVSAYNSAMSTIAALTKYDPTGQNTGALLGDSTAQNLATQMRNITGGLVSGSSGAFNLLSQIGVSAATDGTLSVDTSKLNSAIGTDLGSIQKLFSGSSGIGTQLKSLLGNVLQTGGPIDSKTQALQSDLKNIATQQDALNTRMDAEQTRLMAQYSALDSLVATLKSTQTYLTQQLANLPGWTSNSKSG
ncbi:MAG: hypothetical protein E6R07_04215 [Nevskiaceae bacterium]|nr:MAG: hypothetical protein E6R07_04215 [Nevskiaceae bacterium]